MLKEDVGGVERQGSFWQFQLGQRPHKVEDLAHELHLGGVAGAHEGLHRQHHVHEEHRLLLHAVVAGHAQ